MKVILASASPRRNEILSQVGVTFDVIPSDFEEIITKSAPGEVVKELSFLKAQDVYTKLINKKEDNFVVIGADTVVASNKNILGKPKDKDDAFNMIKDIQGSVHQVYTGVTLVIKNKTDEKVISFFESTDVYVNSMNEKAINEYISTDEPYDKAGGYAIQGKFAANISKIDGDYYNVVGLPIAAIIQKLRDKGIEII